MKFLLDENIPNKYKDILIENGYSDVTRINDFGKGLPDTEVFNIAYKQKRVIVTIDKDFYEYKKVNNFGIISISSKLVNPMFWLVNTIEQIKKDERFENDFVDFFVKMTCDRFEVTCKNKRKKRNKYKTYNCKYKFIKKKKS